MCPQLAYHSCQSASWAVILSIWSTSISRQTSSLAGRENKPKEKHVQGKKNHVFIIFPNQSVIIKLLPPYVQDMYLQGKYRPSMVSQTQSHRPRCDRRWCDYADLCSPPLSHHKTEGYLISCERKWVIRNYIIHCENFNDSLKLTG